MNKKIIFLACVIGIMALLSLSYVSANISEVDTSDWVNITVENVNFQIPPEYKGGTVSEGGNYVYNTVFDFGLVCLETNRSLKANYGYESTHEDLYDVEEMEIDGHHAVAYFTHRSICNHDVVYLYFESNKTFYALSYNGNEVNDTIKKIVSYSPKSALSKEKFNNKLNTLKQDYIEDQRNYELEEAYDQGYRNGYSESQKYNRHDDYFTYYLFYKLGKRSR